MPENKILELKFLVTELDTYHRNTLANGLRKRRQHIHGRCDPFCESLVAILRLVECGDLLSKDGEDSLGGIAGFKAHEKRMGG
jgi:hypothetical protein